MNRVQRWKLRREWRRHYDEWARGSARPVLVPTSVVSDRIIRRQIADAIMAIDLHELMWLPWGEARGMVEAAEAMRTACLVVVLDGQKAGQQQPAGLPDSDQGGAQ